MSGQWEVVGSKKNKQSKLPVPKGSEKQDSKNKNSVNGVKIEEVREFFSFLFFMINILLWN